MGQRETHVPRGTTAVSVHCGDVSGIPVAELDDIWIYVGLTVFFCTR